MKYNVYSIPYEVWKYTVYCILYIVYFMNYNQYEVWIGLELAERIVNNDRREGRREGGRQEEREGVRVGGRGRKRERIRGRVKSGKDRIG